jgi:hypothetical protein
MACRAIIATSRKITASCRRYSDIRRHYASVNSDPLTEPLKELKSLFPDRYGLHARIDTLVSGTNTPKIGIIPLGCRREEIKTLLEALLADPLASDQSWHKAFTQRLLSKDVLIKWAPVFEYVATKNSLIEYPVPFHILPGTRGENAEILEANSLEDSWEHVKDCHLHVFVSSKVHSLTNAAVSQFPAVVVLDLPGATVDLIEDVKFDQNTVVVSSKVGMDAINELVKSSSNAGTFLSLWDRSKLETLQKVVFEGISSLNIKLLDSVIKTCEAMVAPTSDPNMLEQNAQEGAEEITRFRQKWSEAAHRELQTTVVQGLEEIQYTKLAWWKLYYKVDDIYDIAAMTIQRSFLPESRTRLDYYLGRIDSRAVRDYGCEPEVDRPSEILEAQRKLNEQAVVLHNRGLKLMSRVLFGLQVPMTVVPLLGSYFYDFSLYSMGSLIALGTVLGFRQLQKGWLKATDTFNRAVTEEAREVVGRCERSIWEAYEKKVLDQQGKINHRVGVLDQVTTIAETIRNDTRSSL